MIRQIFITFRGGIVDKRDGLDEWWRCFMVWSPMNMHGKVRESGVKWGGWGWAGDRGGRGKVLTLGGLRGRGGGGARGRVDAKWGRWASLRPHYEAWRGEGRQGCRRSQGGLPFCHIWYLKLPIRIFSFFGFQVLWDFRGRGVALNKRPEG